MFSTVIRFNVYFEALVDVFVTASKLPVVTLGTWYIREQKQYDRWTEQTYQHIYGERHDEHGHQEVGEAEADDEVVGGGLQAALTVDAEDHQDVAEEGEEREDDEDEGVVVLGMGHGTGGVRRVPGVVELLQKREVVPVALTKH